MEHSLAAITEAWGQWLRQQLPAQTWAQKGVQIHIKGHTGSALAFAMEAVASQSQKPQLMVAQDREEAAYLFNDLQALVGNQAVFFPESYRRAYDVEETDNGNIMLRTEALNLIGQGKASIMVSYPEALSEKVLAPQTLKSSRHTLSLGDPLDMDFLTDLLIEFDFEREDFVYEPGQFALRGGLMDVFSYAMDQPVRIEFDGDSIGSLRTFDPESQLSTGSLSQADLVPSIERKLEHESRIGLIDFFPVAPLLWTFSTEALEEKLKNRFAEAQERFDTLDGPVKRQQPNQLYLSAEAWRHCSQDLVKLHFGKAENQGVLLDLNCRPPAQIHKNFALLKDRWEWLKEQNQRIFLMSDQEKQRGRLFTILGEQFPEWNPKELIDIVSTGIRGGFEAPDLGLAIYTDHEIFDKYRRFKLKARFSKEQAVSIKELAQLQPGDYVTHIDHGVCQFAGLEKQRIGQKVQEVIKLVFKDGDSVFVSIHSLHRISRYSGKDGKQPSLSKLGSQAWSKLKAKAKSRVKELAFDLLKLYARRKQEKGFAFGADTYLMHELEASFPFEETPDQAQAIADVKADMERPYPMDRLVCGDVGFGKTEVALRAAFKAVCDGKQVAVLVPTTILALQHFKTFKKRMEGLPVSIDYMNRFRSTAQQKESLAALADGRLDILIGTHRIIGKDVKFKDLGLLIVDEEQKFGVSAKEKLKTLRVNVDTLTMTATPIPRTLQFSLLGARDLSVIRTPPHNRYPVITEIKGFNEAFIRDALLYELGRNGQVFFLHNRVSNLPEIAGMLQRLVPDAKIRYAHGQMDGKELEGIMLDFIEGEFDVLVSTSIIENGLDVPNANTMIINQAHTHGLSDLHQMRGRVGRGNRKAFCYLITPPFYGLPQESRRRLQALVEFSDLGSGFNIAMKDLDIRGAGDLLGAEQSGFVHEMGYETYQRILAEAVQELKEESFKATFKEELESQAHQWAQDCQIDTDMALLLPDSYVDQIAERLALYKELDSLDSRMEVERFGQKLEDRFGPLPPQAQELLKTIELRMKARSLGIEKLVLKGGRMLCYFPGQDRTAFYESQLFQSLLNRLAELRKVQMNQKNDRLTLSFQAVDSVQKALTHLEDLMPVAAVSDSES